MSSRINRRFKLSRFWQFQIIGWTLFISADILANLKNINWTLDWYGFAFVYYGVLFILILGLRLAYRNLYRKFKEPVFYFLVSILGALCTSMLWVPIASFIINRLSLGEDLIFTQRNWAFVRVVIIQSWVTFVWSVLYFGYKFWKEMLVEKQRATEAVLLAQKAQLKSLRNQLNPHFLFNSLNSIQALFRENPDQADFMITELSEFLRYSLKYNERIMIAVEEEIDIVKKYLTIEKIRYEEKLIFTINIDDNALLKEIPCLITQPLVENAIKHGLYKNPEGIMLEVMVKYIDKLLKIQVKNTGKLLPGWSCGIGLKNVNARLQNAYKDRAVFSLTEFDNTVLATIEILMLKDDKNDCPDY